MSPAAASKRQVLANILEGLAAKSANKKSSSKSTKVVAALLNLQDDQKCFKQALVCALERCLDRAQRWQKARAEQPVTLSV